MGGFWRAGLVLAGVWLTSASIAAGDVYGGMTIPYDRTFLTQPTISWNVYSTGPGKIAAGKILLNGLDLDAKYDQKTHCVVATPERPLRPGKYSVVARAVFDGGAAYKCEWDFEVLPSASMTLPELNLDQLRAIEAVNRFRDKLGLPALETDPRLCAAAMKHTEFNALNKTTGHYERPNMPGFIGEGPAERIQAYGFLGDSYEAVSFGCRSLEESVQSLIDAPYHRIPFLQPGKLAIGAGALGERLTLDFELGDEKGVLVYPSDGQIDVPVSWGKVERPNPLRIHPKDIFVVGYPITLVYYGKELRLSDVQASLKTEAGEDVPFLLNTPDNDTWLRNGIILMARKPLSPGTTYCVTVSAKASDGQDVERFWKFTTAISISGIKPPPVKSNFKAAAKALPNARVAVRSAPTKAKVAMRSAPAKARIAMRTAPLKAQNMRVQTPKPSYHAASKRIGGTSVGKIVAANLHSRGTIVANRRATTMNR